VIASSRLASDCIIAALCRTSLAPPVRLAQPGLTTTATMFAAPLHRALGSTTMLDAHLRRALGGFRTLRKVAAAPSTMRNTEFGPSLRRCGTLGAFSPTTVFDTELKAACIATCGFFTPLVHAVSLRSHLLRHTVAAQKVWLHRTNQLIKIKYPIELD
jgi:hypothetical protein